MARKLCAPSTLTTGSGRHATTVPPRSFPMKWNTKLATSPPVRGFRSIPPISLRRPGGGDHPRCPWRSAVVGAEPPGGRHHEFAVEV